MSSQYREPVPSEPPLAQVCAGIRLSDGARALLRDDMEPLNFVRLLRERAFYTDGINVLGRLFPKREGVWWACQCARQSVTKSKLPAPAEAALAATEQWVAEPNEAHRRTLMPAAHKSGLDTAAGCAALAGFASGGSLLPPEYEPVYPQESMTAELVAGSVLIAGVAEDSDHALERYRIYLEHGITLYEDGAKKP